MKTIKHVFSIGYRCNSTYFLRKYNLTKISSPFDWVFIDFDSCMKILRNNFDDFLNDIVITNKYENSISYHYPKNYENPKLMFIDLLNKNICYMSDSYNDIDVRFNQNYISELSENLIDIYFIQKVCIFHHFDLKDPAIVKKLKKRINTFKNIMKNPESVLLFHMSKIIDDNNLEEIMSRYKPYNNANYVILLCCSKFQDSYVQRDNILFIIKNVPSYAEQYETGKTDDDIWNFDFSYAYDIMKKFFIFT